MTRPTSTGPSLRLLSLVLLAIVPAVGLIAAAIAALAEVDRGLARILAGLAAVTALAPIAAWALAETSVWRPVQALLVAVRRLGTGDLSARTGLESGAGELGRLAGAFDEMAAAFERTREDLRRQEETRLEEIEREQQTRATGEADRLKSEFLSLASHELRTPLTAILGYVDLLIEGEAGEVTEEQQECLRVIKASARRQLALIDDLLDLARLESGRLELERVAVDLGSLIRGVADSLRPLAEGKGQRLALELPPDLPTVWADADRVSQILTNLISNASKYTPANGRITVSARATEGRARIAVRDTGIGLSPEDQARVF
ncbi:MAG TPA: histidine kinase dimerization/phospho-acceptor domain-containing protein, partial [Dehalococcoidia bacterium]|nr:histidine kinase dimerization/phospho-acceptor domain-containing protein [Dehalococcoidia bacterium]